MAENKTELKVKTEPKVKTELKENNNDDEINIEFEKLEIFPNECNLSDKLTINGSYKSSHSFQGKWKINYIVDSSFTKHVINLGETDNQQISNKSSNNLQFKVNEINISNINDNTLFNTGLLKLELIHQSNGTEVISVNVVTQITRTKEQKYIRTFFNPLE